MNIEVFKSLHYRGCLDSMLSRGNRGVSDTINGQDFLIFRYDDFAYSYHRYELPLLNYTICTDSDDLWRLNTKFMPKTSFIKENVPQRRTNLESRSDLMRPLMEKPIWQVRI